MIDASPPRLIRLPCAADPCAEAARLLIDTPTLPDLGACLVWVPDPRLRAPLLAALEATARAAGHGALLAPEITTLGDWVSRQPLEVDAPLPLPACELLLVEALRGFERLFGDADPWFAADSLLALFQELTREGARLGDSEDGWQQQLARAYGILGEAPAPMGREAAIVHRLWQAWHQQLADSGRIDPATAHVQRIDRLVAEPPAIDRLLILGQARFTRPERRLIEALAEHTPVTWLVQDTGVALPWLPDWTAAALPADIAPTGESLFDRLFPDDDPLLARAETLRSQTPAPPPDTAFAIYAAADAEQEARAVDLAVRRWLLAGCRNVAVVTEDRRLARRVRALLERAGIELVDSAGWALSTTSAATAVECWLQCVEEDFPHQALFDLLKSPFFPAADREAHLATVYRLEEDLVHREGVGRGLDRYRRHLGYRSRRLGTGAERSHGTQQRLLDRLDSAATPLRPLIRGAHPPHTHLAALLASLDTLGLTDILAADAAGERLLHCVQGLMGSDEAGGIRLAWPEFRAWLGRRFEQTYFRPGSSSGPVQLLSLEQSAGLRCDALVLAGCDQESLPGPLPRNPFFNDAVRADLGLPTGHDHRLARRAAFRTLLSAAPRRLLTWHREADGEPRLPSPWLAGLLALYRQAWGREPGDDGLDGLLTHPGSRVAAPEPAPLPEPPRRPDPPLSPALWPERLSPTGHQTLIDCPYRFRAAVGLRLTAPEPIREALTKAEYGERVHRCLEAFHNDLPGLPGPFRKPLDEKHREAAIALHRAIAEAVFARDLEDNFEHRGWLHRWLERIPSLVEWEIERHAVWRVKAVEQKLASTLAPGLVLAGRLDRLDTSDAGTAIIDYKTGRTPDQADVESGEAVQLPSYALLAPDVTGVAYLLLDGERVKTGALLEGDVLAELTTGVRERLVRLAEDIRAGAGLPAWGDAATCRYCEMDGLCRRPVWEQAGAEGAAIDGKK